MEDEILAYENKITDIDYSRSILVFSNAILRFELLEVYIYERGERL